MIYILLFSLGFFIGARIMQWLENNDDVMVFL